MRNRDLEQEIKSRLADRYTAAELVEILDPPVEDIIEEYWEQILENEWLLGQLSFGG